MCSAIGLRHPASASCLGRHSRLAGRCPNNSSLFPPLAAVVVVALCAYSAEELFIISRLSRPAGRSKRYFHGRGRTGKRHLQRRFLRKRGAAVSGLALSVIAARCHTPLFVAARHLPPARGKSFLKGRGLGIAAQFPVHPQSLRFRQRLSLWESWQARQGLTERARTFA